jgi:cellulose biosynthesis protein BcsQ
MENIEQKQITENVEIKKLNKERAENAQVIGVFNNKGGSGKTSTAIALGMHFVRTGKNVLLWDNDQQCNLSQRLGLSDNMYRNRRLNMLFRNADMLDVEPDQKTLDLLTHYRHLYKTQKSVKNLGLLSILGGSHVAEIEAKSVREKLPKNDYLSPDEQNIFKVYRNGVRSNLKYYDYVIIDTSPAMEGNILCQLAARTVDQIICPVDGLEAATGVKQLVRWLRSETSPDNGVSKRPNMLFAMVKYQNDNGAKSLDPTLKLRNSVYKTMKEHFGDYVCDNGIKELQTLKNKVYGGFGRKTHYDALCNEIMTKVESDRINFFERWDNDVLTTFEESLAVIQSNSLARKPTFSYPRYN